MLAYKKENSKVNALTLGRFSLYYLIFRYSNLIFLHNKECANLHWYIYDLKISGLR